MPWHPPLRHVSPGDGRPGSGARSVVLGARITHPTDAETRRHCRTNDAVPAEGMPPIDTLRWYVAPLPGA